MAREDDFKPRPGFQKSETSGVEVIFYLQTGDPVSLSSLPPDKVEPTGTGNRAGGRKTHSVVAVSTQKTLGAPSGTWQVTIKPATHKDAPDLLTIQDDTWVDIVYTRHGRKFHTMRGLVDDVRKSVSVSGTGATSTMWTISGRDFGKVWETTPVWFNPYVGENVSGAAAMDVFNTNGASRVAGAEEVVEGYIKGFLEKLGDVGRANWNPPKGMPGFTVPLVEAINFDASSYDNLPERLSFDTNYLMPNGTLWDLAQEWSDPMFTELYVDLWHQGSAPVPGVEIPIDETEMMVIFRDKPFPMSEGSETIQRAKGSDSIWFDDAFMPVFVIPRESIVSLDVGRTGLERYNAFFCSPLVAQEAVQQSQVDLAVPLWDHNDIFRHGLRRFDVVSKYTPTTPSGVVDHAKEMRETVRDWYAPSPYLTNGTISLAHGMPDIRIGCRARIPGALSEEDDQTFYIEGVSHEWRYGIGIRTSLTVTRGFTGTDQQLTEFLDGFIDRYTEAKKAEPAATPSDVAIA